MLVREKVRRGLIKIVIEGQVLQPVFFYTIRMYKFLCATEVSPHQRFGEIRFSLFEYRNITDD